MNAVGNLINCWYNTKEKWIRIQDTVLPPNSRFLGPGIFRELEIREFIIHDFPPNSLLV